MVVGTAQSRAAKEGGLAADTRWPDDLWLTDRGWMVAGLSSGLCRGGLFLFAKICGSNSNWPMCLRKEERCSETN